MAAVQVLLADDHVSWTQALKLLLEHNAPDLSVVGVAHTASEAVEQATRLGPALVSLDLCLPGRNDGIQAASLISTANPLARIVMLTQSDDPRDVRDSFAAGACGYVMKTVDSNALIASLRAAAAGDLVLAPVTVARYIGLDGNGFTPRLDEKEKQILRLMADGMDNRELAREVAMSESTLRRSIVRIKRKLGATNRMQAVVSAMHDGLL